MNVHTENALEGGCACGSVRYRLEADPLIVHACHCRNCQRQTGTWHAVNALVESGHVALASGVLDARELETPSGAGQTVYRCSICQVALWSNYHVMSRGHGDIVRFVRVGTLDEPGRLPPDVHIYTRERNRCAPEPCNAPAFPEFYDLETVWKGSSLKRLAKVFASLQALQPVMSGSGSETTESRAIG